VHIFDAKAGATREPVETPAILIVTSSTNDVSYKQTARRARTHPICVYPSTTTEEFYHYVSVFKINVEEAQQIAELCGTGKIRNLRSKTAASGIVEAIPKFDLNSIHLYTSTSYTSSSNVSSLMPSLLIDAFLPILDIGNHGDDHGLGIDANRRDEKYVALKERYLFKNATWFFSSKYITTKVLTMTCSKSKQVVYDFFNTIGEENMGRMFGPMAGQILEFLSPGTIAEKGLVCASIREDNKDGADTLEIPKGLVLKAIEFSSTENILKTCCDPKKLYNFGKCIHGFDMFNPPNNFFQITHCLSGHYKHSLNLSTFLKCCDGVMEGSVNLILVVTEDHAPHWLKKRQPWKVNDEDVVIAINDEKNLKISFVVNSERALTKLPIHIQNKLSKLRVYVGGVNVRSYSTQALRTAEIRPFGKLKIRNVVNLALRWWK
jgi:hypothetical protein